MYKIRSLAVHHCLLVACSSGLSSQPPPNTAPGAAPTPLRLRSASWPPFVDTADNPRVAVDLVTAALSRAGYRTDNEIAPLDDVLLSLRGTDTDGSAALWKSNEREEFLLYSDPYLENRLLLVGVKGSDVSADSFARLKGKRVGIVQGYAYGPELDQASDPVFVRQATTEETLRSLLRGDLDYVLTDALVLHQLEQSHAQQMREKLVVGEHVLVRRTLHLVLRKDLPDAERILVAFNKALAQMLHDGSYHEALHVSWIEADIDGDGVSELVAAGGQVGAEPPSKGYRLVGLAGAGSDHDQRGVRFVIKGVPYDSWTAVPEQYKSQPSEAPLGNKPTTLRASVFEY